MLIICCPCQSDVSGEIVKILLKDGGKLHLYIYHPALTVSQFSFYLDLWSMSSHDSLLFNMTDPVGYGDALISILPSFPGIKKLQ